MNSSHSRVITHVGVVFTQYSLKIFTLFESLTFIIAEQRNTLRGFLFFSTSYKEILSRAGCVTLFISYPWLQSYALESVFA